MQKTKFKLISFLWFLQLLFSLLFISFLYKCESSLIDKIKESISISSYNAITNFLYQKQPLLHSIKIWLLAWPCFILSISFIILKRTRWFFVSLTGILTIIYIIADRLNFSYFSSIICFSRLKAIRQLPDISSSILDALSLIDFYIIFFSLVFAVWGVIYNKYVKSDINTNLIIFCADKTVGVLFFFISLYAFNLSFYFENKKVIQIENNSSQNEIIIMDDNQEYIAETSINKTHFTLSYKTSTLDYAATFGIINYHISDIFRSVKKIMDKSFATIKPDDRNLIQQWLNKREQLNMSKTPFWGIAKNKNIIVVSLESFHPSLIDLKINGEEVTPVINELSKQGLYWPYIIDQSVNGGTSDPEFSFMTGLLPSTDVVSAFDLPQRTDMTCLPSVMVKNGYRTLSFHGYKSTFWNRNLNHPIFGIQKMFFSDSFVDYKTKIGFGISDYEFFTKSAEYLNKEIKPFFAYLISLSAHHPYEQIPEGYKNKFDIEGGEPQTLNYLRIQNYVDKAIGNFVDELKNKGLWDNSILVLFGDHVPPMRPETKKNYNTLFNIKIGSIRETRIPLIIVVPGKDNILNQYKEKYTGGTGSLNDLFPTILDLAGIVPPVGISGVNLFVKPSLRDPIPIMTHNTFWAYDGAIYNGATNNILSDDKGIIFQSPKNGIIDDKKTLEELFKKSFIEKQIYKVFYENGGLSAIIKDR